MISVLEEIYEILKTFEPTVCKDVDCTLALIEKAKIFPTVQDAVMAAVDQDSEIQKQVKYLSMLITISFIRLYDCHLVLALK